MPDFNRFQNEIPQIDFKNLPPSFISFEIIGVGIAYNPNYQTKAVNNYSPKNLIAIFLPIVTHSFIEQSSDWSMLAANPQRTSWTPEEVRGNLSVEWYHPIEPYIPYKIQPIAANGKIYVSTSRGLYAFNASDGSIAWVYPTELPLGHSPTIATTNGRSVAYVGGYDRKIHTIDAISGQRCRWLYSY